MDRVKDYVIEDEESLDDLQINNYYLIQKKKGFRYGIDSVLLSDFLKIRKEGRLMDLCSGSGVVALLAGAKYPLTYIEGMEIQKDYADMASRSVEMNGLSDRIKICQGDLKNVRESFPAESFDYVTCNPPYMIGSHGQSNQDQAKSIARHEVTCTLSDVIAAAAWLLPVKGHFYMVHRPFRLAEIIDKLKKGGLEPKRMRMVYPTVKKEPNMVLIDAVKGGRERVTVEAPLIIYREDGTYTEEILHIYGKEEED